MGSYERSGLLAAGAASFDATVELAQIRRAVLKHRGAEMSLQSTVEMVETALSELTALRRMVQLRDAAAYKKDVAVRLALTYSPGDRVELPSGFGEWTERTVEEVDVPNGRLRLDGGGWWSLEQMGLRKKVQP